MPRKKKFKYTITSLHVALICALLIFIFFLIGLLIFEYRYFKQQAQRMLELQKDYQEYIAAFKRILYSSKKKEFEFATYQQELYLDEKNSDDISDNCLNLVNREKLYLRDCALGFGKKHNLERVIKPLYEGGNLDTNYAQAINQRFIPNLKQKSTVKSETVNYYPVDFVLSWPINKAQFWISSKFGPRKKRFHYGLDMAALKGTPVYAAMEGVVTEASHTPKGYGKSIVIDHKKCKTRYAHLNEMFVKVGQSVGTTKPIGTVGKTGLVEGKKPEHLHFEVIDRFGKRINPLYILK
jgi:murein DD-endopeptidase MepM/ murein hydrolase activator NlpD